MCSYIPRTSFRKFIIPPLKTETSFKDGIPNAVSDLQFQIVFSKDGVALVSSSSPSSDEDIQGRKIMLSPKQVNTTPLQIELMERDIAELKTNLGAARTKNVYLQNIVDEQKKKLSALENEKLDITTVGKKTGKENNTRVTATTGKETNEELQEKLEDADRLIRRLRRENEEQRKEVYDFSYPSSNAAYE